MDFYKETKNCGQSVRNRGFCFVDNIKTAGNGLHLTTMRDIIYYSEKPTLNKGRDT